MPDERDAHVVQVDLTDEMKQSYIDYAMSVVVNRALPDARDGLKPVHRRILYAMREMGLTPDKPHRKAARVVGEVMGKYHPHGDVALYDTIVRLAQDFNMRHILVDGHGNFGSLDGDRAGAMRYTECRLASLAMEMLADLDKETVDFQPNFDESLQEPVVLPARFPNLLVNGSSGIAVGMSTNIPPHNLREVIDGIIAMIDDPDITSEELMRRYIKGPDFPTGGLILGRDAIKQAYTTGRGVITMRGVANIEVASGNRTRIVITEIPYQQNKARLVEKIAELVRDKRLEGISDLRDESDRRGVRVVVELARGANPHVLLNKLYKHTPLQQSFGIILLALVDNHPKVLTLRDALSYYLAHQKEVIVRRTRYELGKAEERAHILEGLRVALDHIDEIITLIRGSRTVEIARQGLIETFSLTEKQAQAILDMRLQRLTGLEREKIEEEYRELLRNIEYLRAVLQNERMVYSIIRKELTDIRDRYGDERRTTITGEDAELEIEDLIAEEDVVITLSHQGYIKRMPVSTYRNQKRGGRGILGMTTKDDDFVEEMFITTTHHYILFFTNRGKVYRMKAHEVPEAGRQARGTPVINLIQIEPGELVTAVIPVKELREDRYLFMATDTGYVKKTPLREFDTSRRGGLIAIGLDEDSQLIEVALTDGQRDMLLATRLGQAIRFQEGDVRPMGRAARGVYGIRLEDEDEVVGMGVIDPAANLLVVTEKGFGKRTPPEDFRPQNRGGKGLRCINISPKTGPVVGIKMVHSGNEIMLVTEQGIIIRFSVDDISQLGRYAQGVTLMRPEQGDRVASVAYLVARESNGELPDSEEDQTE